MVLPSAKIDRAQSVLKQARRIVCICHRNPDGDAVGSLTGMAQLLEENVAGTPVVLACVDAAPETFHFLPLVHRILQDFSPEHGDAYIFLDSAEPKLTEYHERFPQLFDKSLPTLCFDHHPDSPQFAQVNFVEPDAASTCEIVAQFADAAKWTLPPGAATSLLTGVYTDTGGLLHSNTTSGVYRTVARLLRAGANRQLIVQQVFRTAKISTLRLWGRVLEKITLTEEGAAVSALTEGDFKATRADYSELTGSIDYVNAIPGMKFSLILAERRGTVKGSLRTLRDDVDVSEMAQKLQGGGHRKAAGFAVPGKLKPEIRWRVEAGN